MAANNSVRVQSILDKLSSSSKDSGAQKDYLAEFIDNIIEEKAYSVATLEMKEMLKKDLLKRLDTFIATRVINKLSIEDLAEFNKLLDGKKPETEIQAFVASHVPDYVGFITDTLLEFRGVYLGIIDVPTGNDELTSIADNPVKVNREDDEGLPPAPPAMADDTVIPSTSSTYPAKIVN